MEISLGKLPFDLDFHPSNPLVAAGLITGDLLLYRYAADSPPQRAAVNRIISLSESTIASGDDEGCIKVWDTRQRTCCNSFDVHEEYISDMTLASDSIRLLGTRFDGEILGCGEYYIHHIVSGIEVPVGLQAIVICSIIWKALMELTVTVQTRSEFSEDELLSVLIMKNGRKVICGTQTGTLLLYSWGFFKDCSDRFVDLSPNSIDALLKLDEDRVITGSENGLISLVGILPNRIIQPIAEHSEYPIERLAFSHDKKFLGSISHDHTLKLWDMDDLLQGSGNPVKSRSAVADSDSDEADEMDMDDTLPKSSQGTKRNNSNKDQGLSSSNNFFADLD
ncbi:hypothetical protein TEA_016068 [Camellia sinensis var. sinensis]|uniref:WD repeat-containing protein 55 n=1 Tax=Camellia sinensis var. sinensis TaxID=542762 RepID=A0A4S4ECC7_CAMSN|nr:hypothetical protein TEA_016068 [Camellia sinensis var. sinensis]